MRNGYVWQATRRRDKMEDNMQGSQAGSTNRNECSQDWKGNSEVRCEGEAQAASSSVLERGEIHKMQTDTPPPLPPPPPTCCKFHV